MDSHSVCWENPDAAQNSNPDGKNCTPNLNLYRTVNSTNWNNMHNWHQQVSSVNTLPKYRILQRAPIGHINFSPSVSHQAGLDNQCSKDCTNTYMLNLEPPSQPALNIQSNIQDSSRMQESVPYKKRKRFLVTVTEDNPGNSFVAGNIVLAEDQIVTPDKSCTLDNGIRHFNKQFEKSTLVSCARSTQPSQQDACLSKQTYKKNITQKAVAVVAPLTQEVVECKTSAKDSIEENEGGLKTKSVADKPYHQIPLQSSIIQHGSESCRRSCVAQIHYSSPEMPTTSKPATGVLQGSELKCPIQVHELPPQNKKACCGPLGSMCMRQETTRSFDMDRQCQASFLCEDVSVTNKSNDGSERRMDTDATDKWSLQRLHRLMIDLERRHRMSLKEVHFTDISSEILKLFWNGDYQKLCDTSRSDHYANIMKEVALYCGRGNPVILQERPKKKLDPDVEDFCNLKQNPVHPLAVSESFISNINDKLNDSNMKHGDLSPLMSTVDVAVHKETAEGDEIVQVAESENAKTSNEKASGTGASSQAPSQLLDICLDKKSIVGGGVLREAENKGACSKRGTAVQSQEPLLKCSRKPASTVSVKGKDATVNSIAEEDLLEIDGENKATQNEVSLQVTLNKQSPAVSENTILITPENQATTEVILSSDDADSTEGCAFWKIKVLSPETAKQMSAIEPNEVKTIHKYVPVETFSKTTDQAVVELCDRSAEDEVHMVTKMKPAGNTCDHTTDQLEKYCCLNKWIQVLGYPGSMPCTCKEISSKGVVEESSTTDKVAPSPASGDASMDELEIVDVISDHKSVHKIVNLLSEQRMEKPLRKCGAHAFKKKGKGNTCDAGRKKKAAHTRRGRFAAKPDPILKISHDAPIDLSLPLTRTHGLQAEKDKKTTTPEVQKGERMVNLTLFGSSITTPNRTRSCFTKRRTSGIKDFDMEHFPPATLNVKVSPSFDDVNSDGRQTAKQRVMKSWQNSVVVTAFTGRKRSKKLKCPRSIESKSETAATSGIEMSASPTAFDAINTLLSNQHHIQTHGPKMTSTAVQQNNPSGQLKIKRHSTKRAKKNKKRKMILKLINPTSGRNIRNKHKSTSSSFELPSNLSRGKHESRMDVALDFRVLPESFRFTGGSPLKKVQSSNIVNGKKNKAENELEKNRTLGNQGIWCVSPKKKGLLRSTLASVTGSTNTFQEFKRRYEEKKHVLHPSDT